jgi:TRAP-type mannitol/chloroaromatic compound transport system permease small subunit
MTASATLVRWLDRCLDALRWLARAAVIIGGAAILVSGFLIAGDVVMRRVLGLSTWGADELSYYALAISSSWAFAHAMLVKAHIRIDMLTMRASWPLRSASNIVALASMGFLALMACGAILEEVERAWSRGETSITRLATPLWIPQGLWLAGFAFFALTTFLLLLRVIAALLIERSHQIAELHGGTPTLDDEIGSEARSGSAREGGD